MQDLEEIEKDAKRVLDYYEECYTHFKRGIVALSLVRRWRNAFCNGVVDLNETMNFCRDTEMFKNDYDLAFHGFYNSNVKINHKLWEAFLTDSLNKSNLD